MKTNLGVIGYGGMGKLHAKFSPMIGVNIVAVCDIREDRCKEAEENGFKAYRSADELLKDENVNTVILTVDRKSVV